ncbi:MAG: hypothetical protein B7X36_10765 [Thiomonas sp. 14-64-326]|nr:MAG: hypothetical protein B7X36_10765 [Thiomonas sp. 14-64-326]
MSREDYQRMKQEIKS